MTDSIDQGQDTQASKDATLIGKVKELEVASLLAAQGLYVFFPLVDNGFDLVVASRDTTKFIPVQVRYKDKRSGFTLSGMNARKNEIKQFKDAGAVIAFGSKNDPTTYANANDGVTNFWFIPIEDWITQSKDLNRADGKVAVYLGTPEMKNWANDFHGESGIKKAFAKIF